MRFLYSSATRIFVGAVALILWFGTSGGFCVGAELAITTESPQDLRPLLEPIIARAGIPGISALVLKGDRIVARGVAGTRRKGSGVAVEADDQFEICSCSKAMLTTVLATLVEEGKVRWDTPLSELFNDASHPNDPSWKHVTLWDVVTHRAGLRDRIGTILISNYFTRGTIQERRLKYAEKVLRAKPSSPPGEVFVYSNTDYIVAAVVIEKITGDSWETAMRRRLFEPLGMNTAGFGPPGTPGQVDQPWGHGRHQVCHVDFFGKGDTAYDPGSASADYPAIWRPAGLVHASVPDWAKFVSFQLRGDSANPHQHVELLRQDSIEVLHHATPGQEYTGGWFVGTRAWAKGPRQGDTGRVLFHPGDNNRWNTVVWMAPEIDLAILIACNRAHTWTAVDEVASALVRTYAKPE